jgi:tetratricopeptide (TPR) repeat protein
MTDDLLALALVDPVRAERSAREVIEISDDLAELAQAHQALGIVLRDLGRIELAILELRVALALARRLPDRQRLSDIQGTYGLTLVYAGRSRAGLRHLDRAAGSGDERSSAMTLMRRAIALRFVDRRIEAHRDMQRALAGFREGQDRTWEAAALHNLGWVELSLGWVEEAERHTTDALKIFESQDHQLDALWARQNLGEIAFCRGDLPRALAIYDQVAQEYEAAGHSRAHLATQRSAAYLAAGLSAEAASVIDEALSTLQLLPFDTANLELMGAAARLASGDALAAADLARRARDGFRRVDNSWSEMRARLTLLQARHGMAAAERWAGEAREVAEALHAIRADEAPVALMLAAKLGNDDLLRRAAGYRNRPGPVVRASGWLAAALVRASEGSRGGTLRACGRGLDALDEHRQTLGSSELRALTTTHGRELAAVALRHAATSDARTLLTWSERWRATALAQPPVTADGDVPASLAALRDNGRRLAEARAEGEPTEQLEQERRRLEREVRAEHHRLAGSGGLPDPRLDVERLVAEVGDSALVELVDVDGTVHVLVVSGGKVRRRIAGSTAQALELGNLAQFALRRAARGRPYDPGDLGSRLQQTLLGDAVRLLPDGPIVVAPTARLHGIPWAMLPTLAERSFSSVPSAAQWLRAKAATTKEERLVLLAGPGLDTGGAEVPVLAKRHPHAVLLDGDRASVEAAMSALDGARLAHVAAHGHFRADSPLFSSLELADGPLTVHDLERLKVAPHRLVLSACESGVLAPVGADELLGLASALFSIGTAGLVSSVAEVNDEATAVLMVELHDRLAQGGGLADALLAARIAASGDPTREATAAAFLALGV